MSVMTPSGRPLDIHGFFAGALSRREGPKLVPGRASTSTTFDAAAKTSALIRIAADRTGAVVDDAALLRTAYGARAVEHVFVVDHQVAGFGRGISIRS